MLAHWLSRGLGQIVAPDPQHEKNEMDKNGDDGDELFSSNFWNMVAPDPNFGPSIKEEEEEEEDGEKNSNVVECIHCHNLTPVKGTASLPFTSPDMTKGHNSPYKTPKRLFPHPTPSSSSMIQSPDASSFQTPKTHEFSHDTPGTTSNKKLSEVEWQVLVATRETAFSLNSPPMEWESRKDFFNICTSTRVNKKKLINRFRRDPTLIHSRSSNMSNFVPDGLTPLMAAASHGNLEICQLLLDLLTNSSTTETNTSTSGKTTNPEEKKKKHSLNVISNLKDALEATNLQGKTALHLAAENHQLEIVRLLRDTMKQHNFKDPVGEHAPKDLVGRTPLGYAALSSKKQKLKKQLEQELFAVGDSSVFGGRTPAKQRGNLQTASQRPERSLIYGWSDIPGYRIDMEDAMCHHYPLTYKADTGHGVAITEWGLFGVFDGHADQGVVSRFLADNMLHVLKNTEEFENYQGGTSLMAQALKSACTSIDVDLKAWLEGQRKSVQKGGSTGVLAVVTDEAIIIANVGDSRCVLVQKNSSYNKETNNTKSSSSNDQTTEDLGNQLEKLAVTENEKKQDNDVKKQTETKEVAIEEEEKEKNKLIQSSPVLAKPMSIDHKPNLTEERLRVEKAGMNVIPEVFRNPNSHPDDEEAYTTIWKVEKSEMEKLGTSRAFGDFDYKNNADLPPHEQAVISVPDFEVHARDPENDLFLILACDGIWDVMNDQEVADFIYSRVNEKKQCVDTMDSLLPEVSDDLLKHCLDLGSRDNMSVLIIALSPDWQENNLTSNQNINPTQHNQNDDVKRAMQFLDE